MHLLPKTEHLNETLFSSLVQARVLLAGWRLDYNQDRPHSRIGWLTPAEYAQTFNPRRTTALRDTERFAPSSAAQTAQLGKSNRQSELKLG